MFDQVYDFQNLKGRTLTSIEVSNDKQQITFTCESGDVFYMCHQQYCCEYVRVEDINGDVKDLVGVPILLAEETTNDSDNMGRDLYESFTWTFYRLATVKGYVTIRWLGESNGYYSESVSFFKKS